MSYTTPKYALTAPDNETELRKLGTEMKAMAQRIEAVLEAFDYNGADPALVLGRVAALEAAAAAPPETVAIASIATAMPGWEITGGNMARWGRLRMGVLLFTRTASAAISVNEAGDIPNQSVATLTLPEDCPPTAVPISTTAAGRVAVGELQTGGVFRLNAVGGSSYITQGDVFSLAGVWFTA